MEHLPEKLIGRLSELLPSQNDALLLHAFANKPLPAFRANTLKISTEKLPIRLENQGFLLKQLPWYPDAFVLQNKSVRELTETKEYEQGLLYIQNLSSMIPALVLTPQPNQKILDLCASPGSKTTQLADRMKNRGEIIANDLSRKRLFKLRDNLKAYGVTNATITNIPGQFIWKKYPEYFDRVLVDVPCSMEGRINVNDPKSYQDWSLKKIKELSNRQKYLLRSAVLATKPGGTVVYSTCTLAPEENEEVIDWVLEKEKGNIALQPIAIPHLQLASGIPSWQKKTFHPEVVKTSRIYPSQEMEGFFIAKIKKVRSSFSIIVNKGTKQ
ncbi:MAG: RsmB/NOP family class I SAM-dependent RNA methyltransferase [Patescibacteria group bacterium]